MHGHTLRDGHGGEEHNGRVARGLERRQRGLEGGDRTEEVHLKIALEIFRGEAMERLERDRAREVDESIEALGPG
jgi:hypothetical protein